MICKTKTIAIVGVGGLGGFVAEYATRLNTKKIILIDGDKFSQSNINRQLLCSKNTIGEYKVDCYLEHAKQITEDSEIVAVKEFLTHDNISLIDECDLVFDCLDNVAARKLLEQHCEKANIPIVHGAIGEKFGNACLCLPG